MACGLTIVVAITAVGIDAFVSSGERIPLRLELGSRSLSKLPYVIALDQGLFEKYGLDVGVYMPQPEFPGGSTPWSKYFYFLGNKTGMWRWDPHVIVRGGNSHIVKTVARDNGVEQILLGSNDCIVRAYVVAEKGFRNLNELKGKRIGVSSLEGNTGFAALLLAERMGWNPRKDMSIVTDSNDLDALRDGRVDAFFANERSWPLAVAEGYPVLANLSEWGEPAIVGNSIRVKKSWLVDPRNREAARRFVKATAEGIALFHQDKELALEVIARWYGVSDRPRAEIIYDNGRWTPRTPYPCYEGIERTMELYDSDAMRNYSPEDFYDDSFIRELDDSGFIDDLYR